MKQDYFFHKIYNSVVLLFSIHKEGVDLRLMKSGGACDNKMIPMYEPLSRIAAILLMLCKASINQNFLAI